MISGRNLRLAALTLLLAATACAKGGGSGGDRASEDAAAFDVAEPPAATVTTRKSEWSVGGIVGGRTETTTVAPPPVPATVIEPPSPRELEPQPQSGPLTAGDVDDLLNPAQYARYAGRFLQAYASNGGGELPFVDTRTRVVVRVTDAQGRPAPFARVEIARGAAPLRLTTAADGAASFYPRFDRVPARTRVTASAPAGRADRSVDLAGTRVVSLALPGAAMPARALDVALVLDTTGSMGDEMAYLREELDAIVARVRRIAGTADVRVGVVLFRDDGDDYVVRSAPLTADIGSVRTMLARQEADGGGDAPEAMDRAVAAAGRLQWRANAVKALLLVTDAPPHEEALAATLAGTQALRANGVQVVPVAASGVEDTAQYVLRTMAALTGGRYVFLTDDSGIGDSHAEPDVACYQVTALSGLLARVLAGIATGKRVEPQRADVIRVVGSYDRGRCDTQVRGGAGRPRQ